jgi:hypothetical protein
MAGISLKITEGIVCRDMIGKFGRMGNSFTIKLEKRLIYRVYHLLISSVTFLWNTTIQDSSLAAKAANAVRVQKLSFKPQIKARHKRRTFMVAKNETIKTKTRRTPLTWKFPLWESDWEL